MKKLLLIALLAISFSNANAQVVPVLTTTIKKGYGNFTVNNMTFPLNSLIINALSNDTSMIELDLLSSTGSIGHNDVLVASKKRVKYINGTTGLPFVSYPAMKAYCDSFLYSH